MGFRSLKVMGKGSSRHLFLYVRVRSDVSRNLLKYNWDCDCDLSKAFIAGLMEPFHEMI